MHLTFVKAKLCSVFLDSFLKEEDKCIIKKELNCQIKTKNVTFMVFFFLTGRLSEVGVAVKID